MNRDDKQFQSPVEVDRARDGSWVARYRGTEIFATGQSVAEAIQALPVRHVILKPIVRQQDDGTWVASYPDHGYEVMANSRQRAIETLMSEHRERLANDPAYRELVDGLHKSPPSSWSVDFVSREDFDSQMIDHVLDGRDIETRPLYQDDD